MKMEDLYKLTRDDLVAELNYIHKHIEALIIDSISLRAHFQENQIDTQYIDGKLKAYRKVLRIMGKQ